MGMRCSPGPSVVVLTPKEGRMHCGAARHQWPPREADVLGIATNMVAAQLELQKPLG